MVRVTALTKSKSTVAGRLTDSDYAAERRVRERASTAAQKDADQGAALAEELVEDSWSKRSPQRFGEALIDDNERSSERSMVRRQAQKKRANFPRPTPLRYAPMVQVQVDEDEDERTEDAFCANPRPRRRLEETHIRACLDRAKGQPASIARITLRDLVEDCDSPLDLKEIVDRDYPTLLSALKYVLAYDVHDHERNQLPEIPTREFTEAERKILESHAPLVTSLAAKYSRGYKSFNHARFADLLEVGLDETVRRIPQWDSARKVTIGAFLRPLIIGAMQARMRTRPGTKTMAHNDIPLLVKENIERWTIDGDTSDSELDGVAASKARKKATKRKAKKPAPTIPTARDAALANLNDPQRRVYDNMRCATPFSNTEMGKRLGGVSEGRVRQIKKDVERILKQTM